MKNKKINNNNLSYFKNLWPYNSKINKFLNFQKMIFNNNKVNNRINKMQNKIHNLNLKKV